MKKVLLVIFSFMLLQSLAAAGPYPYMALYLDEDRTCYCGYGPGLFSIYAFILPSDDGAHGCAFKVEVDIAGMVLGKEINGLDVLPPPSDAEYCYMYRACDPGLHWILKIDIFLIDSTTPGTAYFVDSPTENFLGTFSCEEGYPQEDGVVLTNAYFNTNPCPEIGTESSSWGAIKSIFK